MPAFTCPHCQKAFRLPTASAAQVRCPHCRQVVTLPVPSASLWYYARAKKKHGPFTWQQLLTLAKRGELHSDDMLLQEGSKQWVRADSLPSLFAEKAAVPSTARTQSVGKPRRAFWLIVALAGVGIWVLLAVVVAGYLFLARDKPADPLQVNINPIVEDKKSDPPKKEDDSKTKETKKEEKKPPVKKEPSIPRAEWSAQFVERLNRHRQLAGLGSVTLDLELSRGCLAHAQYLSKHVDPDKIDASQLADEDPQKPGFSVEGKRAGESGMIAFAAPLDALEKWFGRLLGRAALLAPEMQTVGLGFEPNERGDWICVVDPIRGRGEPIVVSPASNQTDVPLSFTDGPEVPDAKAAAGYPITVTFPPTRKVTEVAVELRDAKNKLVEGWLWTPEKPVRPNRPSNSIAFIPKGLLQSDTQYQFKASAQVDGKAWNKAWSFTSEDDSDSKGIWAEKALAKVNAYRKHAGLKPVTLDEKLSRGCLAHARYLVINEGHPELEGLKSHHEYKSLPGYSDEGDRAGQASDIATGDYDPLDGVDAWMATLYHRVPILEPNLQTIGFGCARGRRQGWATVMNVATGRAKEMRSIPVFYPAADQIKVPLNFPNSGEVPNPIPEDKTGRAGFPITATFPDQPPLLDATGKLLDAKGTEVACWFSSPQLPANPTRKQGNTVCLIPKVPLNTNATYHVQMQGKLAGKVWDKKWKFTTGDGGLSMSAATQAVVDRLNRYRAQAGLSPVLLDETLAAGCQLHAEYLGKNAETLLKTNASVNDEDASLPGFTRDGLQAAQHSDVFTNAPTPVMQIDDLMATFSRRVHLLDPALQRIGFGCYHDVGRGWRCVLDVNRGRGDARIVLYPAPKQDDVPLLGFDRVKDVQGKVGFPISVMFPRQSMLRNVQAVLSDANGNDVKIQVAPPDMSQRNLVGVYPLEPLLAGQAYSVTVAVIVNASEWRQTWHFRTAKK
jgi:uncharacterized protein YkwD